jgi:iron(III) transport system substrate-binding protein
LFWNNEILNTLRLDQRQLLQPYRSPRAGDFPEDVQSVRRTWCGFGARARILIVNTNLVAGSDWPTSVNDLILERWRGKVGIAKPLFGTTATHMAVLFASWNQVQAMSFFTSLQANARVMAGNRHVAQAVGAGQLAFGLTDTDDAFIERLNGSPVEIVYPDQEGMGTLFIPNTRALIRGSPNPREARMLADYLLSPEVEAELATSRSAQIPLGRSVSTISRLEMPSSLKRMNADFAQAARLWPRVAELLTDIFARGP